MWDYGGVRLALTQGDTLKVVQNLPGVAKICILGGKAKDAVCGKVR